MPNRWIRAWRGTLSKLGVLLLTALVIGLIAHKVWLCLFIATAGFLAVHLFALHQIGTHLNGPTVAAPARLPGIWRILQDRISARRRAARNDKRRLLAGLRAFRDAAAALPDAVVALDRERHILWFNRAARSLLGLDYPRDLGAPITHLVRATRVATWLDGGAGEPLIDVASPTNEQIRLSLRRIPYAEDQTLLVARDISQLQRLEQVRRDFVANVSHELRTPLTVVHGYLDMLEPEQWPDSEPILHELRTQSRRMTQIVEDLLTLSRLEVQDGLADERVQIAPMLETLKREAEALSQGRHQISIENNGSPAIQGSAKDLHSAFSNLVSNAVRYTPTDGRIGIRWESNDSGARLSVTDTGPGIPAQHLPRLTERFYRVSTSRSRETGGTGLGLSIVKHILQLHQARLEIQSELGVGSTFSCVFGPERLSASSIDEPVHEAGA
ncbi:MAG: phosphate regulon sensor histidine kinase PhoR [Dokdonella sp.]